MDTKRRVKLKICGITNEKDAIMVSDLGADAMMKNNGRVADQATDIEKVSKTKSKRNKSANSIFYHK